MVGSFRVLVRQDAATDSENQTEIVQINCFIPKLLYYYF
jgi:hypothetical protein